MKQNLTIEYAIPTNKPKLLRLKFGEYYGLKITDSGKNVINHVEVTPCDIITEERQFSVATDFKTATDLDKEELKKGLDDKKQDEFDSWTYGKLKKNARENEDILLKDETRNHDDDDDGITVPRHKLECEVQIAKVRKFNEKTSLTLWTPVFTQPVIKTIIVGKEIKYSIRFNKELAAAFQDSKRSIWRYDFLNWRYKLTGGALKAEKTAKIIETDVDSVASREKFSYTYPENTLLQHDAYIEEKNAQGEVAKNDLAESIAKHVISRYKHGRETFEITWQGDPRITIGDYLVLEDKFGIETKYMITGNEFVLENSGKFFMRSEGISVLVGDEYKDEQIYVM
ncbi:MAG: hypothetical protein FWH03_00170 [Firmicutes bacterium]|nr:hypothetical protein [Bacillota bacterium]